MAKKNRRYQVMQGRRVSRGERASMGEHQGNPARYVTEPGNSEGVDPLRGIFNPNGSPSELSASGSSRTPSRQPPLDPTEVVREYGIDNVVLSYEATAKLVEISYRVLSSTGQSKQLDSGLHGRKDILIANMSTATIWVNSRPMNGTKDGFPLGPISAAGKYDGGSISIDASENVPFYGIPSAAGNSEIVVIETAR